VDAVDGQGWSIVGLDEVKKLAKESLVVVLAYEDWWATYIHLYTLGPLKGSPLVNTNDGVFSLYGKPVIRVDV
jgi:hypothetical protein